MDTEPKETLRYPHFFFVPHRMARISTANRGIRRFLIFRDEQGRLRLHRGQGTVQYWTWPTEKVEWKLGDGGMRGRSQVLRLVLSYSYHMALKGFIQAVPTLDLNSRPAPLPEGPSVSRATATG